MVDDEGFNVLENMGVMVLILLIMLVVVAVVVFLIKTCKKGSCCHRNADKLKKKLFWNSFLRYVLQSYLKTSLATLGAVALISFKSNGVSANDIVTILLVIVLGSMPIIFSCVVERNKVALPRRTMKAKIGSLYLGIRTTSWYQRAYSTVFLLRRMWYAVLTVWMAKQPNLLIHTFLFSNLLYLSYTGWASPHNTKLARRVEFFNESGL